MAKVRVSLHGQFLKELDLQSGQEYFIGRGSSCDIQLANERGISRQHVKLLEESGVWTAALISKYGGLIFQGESVEQIALSGSVTFSIPPYDFAFEETCAVSDEIIPSDNLSAPLGPQSPDLQVEEDSVANSSPDSHTKASPQSTEATAVGISTLVPYLKIHNNKTKTHEILKLEGHSWTTGRHPSSEIVLNDSAISRIHFVITHTSDGYFVTDHGSSNGTYLNADKLEPQVPHRLTSGDVLTVRHIEFIFEIHDGAYKDRVDEIDDLDELSALIPFGAPEGTGSHVGALDLAAPEHGDAGGHPVVLKEPPNSARNGKFTSAFIKLQGLNHKQKIMITGAVLIVLLAFVFSGESKKDSASKTEAPAPNESLKLSPDKQREVNDVFNLARSYYLNKKYVLCISQIEKLHEIVPFHNNSKELEGFCRQGKELEEIERDRKRKEEARAEAENKIRKIVEECRQIVTLQTTSEQINSCLQPVLELDPENSAIVELKTLVQVNESNAREQKEKAQDYAQRKRAGESLYSRGMNRYKSGDLKPALSDLSSFVSGRYPGLSQEEAVATRTIASIKKTLDEELDKQIGVCQSALERAELKAAIVSCDLVLKEAPNNSKAKEIRNKAYSQLKRELKSLYEDSILEESMGNIDSAKDKWSKIVDKSIPQDDYYKKSKQKLKKYGIGM